jgi:hypothetical protein
MAQIERPIAYRVDIVDHEGGGGRRRYVETLYFDNEDQARNYVQTFNARNTATTVPNWYMVADYRGRI